MAKKEQQVRAEAMQAIGAVVANFSLLEVIISMLIWTLLKTSQSVGRLVTGRLSSSQLLNLLQVLNNETVENEDYQGRIEEAIGRAWKVNDRRNEIIHSLWTFSGKPDRMKRLKLTVTSKKFDVQEEDLTAKQLRSFAARIQKLTDDFIQLLKDA